MAFTGHNSWQQKHLIHPSKSTIGFLSTIFITCGGQFTAQSLHPTHLLCKKTGLGCSRLFKISLKNLGTLPSNKSKLLISGTRKSFTISFSIELPLRSISSRFPLHSPLSTHLLNGWNFAWC